MIIFDILVKSKSIYFSVCELFSIYVLLYQKVDTIIHEYDISMQGIVSWIPFNSFKRPNIILIQCFPTTIESQMMKLVFFAVTCKLILFELIAPPVITAFAFADI